MSFSLLLVMFVTAAAVSAAVAYLFDRPIRRIPMRIGPDEPSSAGHRHIEFAAFVAGVSGGAALPARRGATG
ncbi:MAG TPA: hypothetical protein VF329_05930 [Gammaproteobacteria bacterium]